MSQDLQVITSKLLSFKTNIEKLDEQIQNKGIDILFIQSRDKGQIKQFISIIQTKNICKADTDFLVIKFRQGRFNDDENMKVQKLFKEFQKYQELYRKVLKQLQQQVEVEQKSLESEYQQEFERRQTQQNIQIQQQKKQRPLIKENSSDSEEEVTQEEQFEEVEVHPDVEHNLQLIKEKNEEIAELQQDVEQTYKIMEDVAKLVFDQGKQLDVAEDNINTANSNVKVAALELEGAQVEHKAYLKKAAGIFFCIALVVVIILAVIFL
ncbi:hypothetical protein pb186bvf_013723 [Paramecium bursaria]